MDAGQRKVVFRQVLASEHARVAFFTDLHERRQHAIQVLLSQTDPAAMHRAQGAVHQIDAMIEEYHEWTTTP